MIKKRNTGFIAKIAFLTLLVIGALAGLFISSLFLIADSFDWLFVGGIVICVPVGYWSVSQIIKLNGTWTSERIDEIQNGDTEVITEWHHPPDYWARYLKWRERFDRKEVRSMVMICIAISTVIFLFSFYSQYDAFEWGYMSLGAGLGMGLVIGMLFQMGYAQRRKKISRSPRGTITFSKDAILINDLLIYFNEMGNKFGGIRIVREDGFDLIKVTIRTRTKDGHNTHDYWIPIPEDKMEEADRLVTLYAKANNSQ